MDAIDILLLEDNPGDARLIQEMLRMCDHGRFALVVTETLRDGLERLSASPPGVILLDLTLPDSNGIDTFLQVDACAGEVPIVVLTGLNDMDVAVSAVHAGAEDYLIKNEVNSPLLQRAVLYAIERAKLRRQLHEALARVKTLHGLIPICSKCKQIRDDRGYWQQVETYVHEHSDADFTHGYCPSCASRIMRQLGRQGRRKHLRAS
jgi:DNA-binding NtrC family response regulator